MRTTLDIDDDVLAAAKELAAKERKTAGKILSEFFRRALHAPAAAKSKGGGAKHLMKNGTPCCHRAARSSPSRGCAASWKKASDMRPSRAIRLGLGCTQTEFTLLLNVPAVTAISWENGTRKPSGAALRLLSVAQHHPEALQAEELYFRISSRAPRGIPRRGGFAARY